jgi:hypothetical protein
VTAQTPALDSGASAHVDFTIAQKQTVYQSISEIIAERIVAAASNGERDPVRLREAAIPWLTHERD